MDTTPAKILVVEDNEVIAISIRQLLSKHGYEVHYAANGQEAMDKMLEERFDVVVTDLLMPYVSGFQLIDALKRNGYDDTKIIVVTSTDSEVSITEAFALGADDYVKKPLSPYDLLIRISKLLNVSDSN